MTAAIKQIQSGVAPAGIQPQTPAAAQPQADRQLNFSKHLHNRIERRRLDLNAERIGRLNDAVSKAARKGSRESVVFLDELAVLVNVQSRTVKTAIETASMKEGVFTNIDSVVVG